MFDQLLYLGSSLCAYVIPYNANVYTVYIYHGIEWEHIINNMILGHIQNCVFAYPQIATVVGKMMINHQI